MIQAQSLPPGKSVYDYPVVIPGQEMTEEQQAQATLAQIAGVVVAVAAAKSALEAATTNQLVTLLRSTSLLTEAGIDAFIAGVKLLLPLAHQRSREITWSGVAIRADLVGIDFPAEMPDEDEIPAELFYPRSSSLVNAYTRVATEYRENLKRDREDPVIKELITQLEHQGMTPLPRPDNLSSDAVERVVESDGSWIEAFRRAEEEARKEEGRVQSEREVSQEIRRNLQTTTADEDWYAVDLEEFSGDDTPDAVRSLANREQELAPEPKPDTELESGGRDDSDEEVEDPRLVQLTDAEVDEIIERYAEHKAEERVERMVSQDVQGTSRNMHQVAMRHTDPKQVVGFRRVVHPELAESGRSCGLCIVASTMRYNRGDLLPIHSGCNCETVEIFKVGDQEFDPGDQINLQDLGVFYQEAGGTTHGWDLKRQRYEVFDHPEYGPTLVNVTSKKARESATEVEFNTRRSQDGN